jgi:hypothetical protein
MANQNYDSVRRRIHDNGFGLGGEEMLLRKLTSMTTVGVAMLLTNDNAFSSEFTLTFEDGAERPLKATRQAFVHSGKILIETVFGKSEPAGEFGVMWDRVCVNEQKQ